MYSTICKQFQNIGVILKRFVIRPCVVHNFSIGVLFCNNKKVCRFTWNEKREYVHFISFYNLYFTLINHNDVLKSSVKRKTKLNGLYYIRTVVYKLKCLIKFQHSLLGKCFVAFIFNFLFYFISGNIHMKMCPVFLKETY